MKGYFISITMNATFMKKLVAYSCALMLVLAVGTFAPQTVNAQEQGETTPSNNSGGFGNVIRSIFGGGNNPAPTGDGPSNPAGTGGMPNPFNWFGGGNSNPGPAGGDSPNTGTTGGTSFNPFSWFGGGSTPAQTGGGSSDGSGNSPITGFVNWVIDTAINFRNENNLWHSEGGNGIINVAQDTVGSLITGAVNLLTGEVTGTPEGTNANGGQGPLDITPGGSFTNTISSVIPDGGYAEVRTDPVTGANYTTVYDENGNAIRSNDPRIQGQGGSSGSYRGAVGTPGNPLSNGESSGEATDNNESNDSEDTSSPYLFDYDPSSTNNNPSGADAMGN